MSHDVISVLTFKSVQTILQTGGTQSWALEPSRARNCKFAVLCRNANTREAEGNEPHGTAFMVGKISAIVPSTETEGRWLILFSGYALCDWADQWDGRNPVRYWTTDDYAGFDFDALVFQPLPVSKRPQIRNMTISDAKIGLSKTFGVPIEAIEITIRA